GRAYPTSLSSIAAIVRRRGPCLQTEASTRDHWPNGRLAPWSPATRPDAARAFADRTRLRQLRRNRVGAGSLRARRDRGSVRADGRGLSCECQLPSTPRPRTEAAVARPGSGRASARASV